MSPARPRSPGSADPAVGDRIAVATALAPSKGLPSRRDYVEMALLQSATGLAVESYSGDLQMTADGDIVRIGRPKGLLLSSSSSGQAQADAGAGAPQAMSMPALIDPEHWSKTGSGGFMARYDALLGAVPAASGADGKGDDTAPAWPWPASWSARTCRTRRSACSTPPAALTRP
jgi:hypothetical protein